MRSNPVLGLLLTLTATPAQDARLSVLSGMQPGSLLHVGVSTGNKNMDRFTLYVAASDDHERVGPDIGVELDELGAQQAAAVQGLIPFGPRAGHATAMLEAPRLRRQPGPGPKKKLCADHGGFSLHAAVRVSEGKRDRLERLCRYVTRPPLAQERRSVTDRGDVATASATRGRTGGRRWCWTR